MSFYREVRIKATRKPHNCQGCRRVIETGSASLYISSMGDEGLFHGHYHHDCRAAEIALNNLRDYRWNDEWTPLSEIDDEECPWLAAEYPDVSARMFPAPQS